MNVQTASHSESLPMAWRLYRFGLVTGGLAWVCIASTLCGCSGANGWVKNQSGRNYYNRGSYAAARSEFERALLDSPYNATYAYNVGKAMEKEGDIAGAEQMYQHAMTLDPSHQPSYHGMSELLVAQGRQDEASSLLTAWSQTQPYSAASHVEMAQLQRKSGNYAGAEQEINTALQMRPRYRQAMNERSRLYQATGRPTRGGPFSELALTSRTPQQAMQPTEGMVTATPQSSAALNMASTMPQKDPTLIGGVIQASYTNPQMGQMSSMPGGMSPMMSAAPAQMHQANMIPGNMGGESGWMPTQDPSMPASPAMMTQGQPMQTMPMQAAMPGQPQFTQQQFSQQPYPQQQFSQPQMTPQQMVPPQMMPQQMAQPAMGPHSMPMGTPVPHPQYQQQPVELGQPVPITQAQPVYGNPQMMTEYPVNVPTTGGPVLVGAVPTVQAF